jgi:CheY-like chemotaxis protein
MNVDNVLIADTDLENLDIVKNALLKNQIDGIICLGGYLYESDDGMKTINQIKEHPEINVLISDMDMPNLSSDNLINYLINNDLIDKIIVVFMQTEGSSAELSDLAKKHTVGLISKPFDANEFNNAFTNLICEQVQKDEINQRIFLASTKNVNLIFNLLSRLIQKVSPNDQAYQSELPILIDETYKHKESYTQDAIFNFSHETIEHYFNTKGVSNKLTKQHIIRAWMIETNYTIDTPKNPYKLLPSLQKGIAQTQQVTKQKKLSEVELEKSIFSLLNKQLNLIIEDTKETQAIDHKLYNPHYNTIIKNFSKVDAFFMDEVTSLAFAKLKEILLFVDYVIDLYKTQKLYGYLPQTKTYKNNFDTKIKNLAQTSTQLTNRLCAHFNEELWKRAEASQEVSSTLDTKTNSTPSYLLHNTLINQETYNRF